MKTYDAIIIGSGQAGIPLARKLAKAGWNTAIIEKRAVGGTCINDGCTPTKTMIASARMAYMAGHSADLGIEIPNYKVNINAILDRKDAIVHQFRDGAERSLARLDNIELIMGTASFSGPRQVKVALKDGSIQELTAAHIFINTGCRPSAPGINGIEDIPYFDSTTILDLHEIPENLLIIGAGYVGLEFGQMYRRFGSRVTILESSPRLLHKEDPDVVDEIMKFLQADGIELILDSSIDSVTQTDGKINIALESLGATTQLSGSHLLIGAGRTPNTDDLNLSAAGVEMNPKGFIKVDDELQTTVPGIYALGDVNGGPEFTHIAYNDHIIIWKNLIRKIPATTAGRMVPFCMFTDPQLARVGLTEQEALEKGLNILVAKLPMTRVARGIETGDTRGLMKAIVDKDTKQVLGVAILGPEAGEVMSVLQMAMTGGITYDKLRETVFAHPIFSESINNLFMSLDQHT